MAAERFAEQLRALRTSVGDPSFRKMAGRSGRISHTTLHEAAAGTRFPSWETTREFVRACEADEVQWRRRWEDAQRAVTVHAIASDLSVGSDGPDTVDGVTGEVVAAETPDAGGAPATGVPAIAASSNLAPEDQRVLRIAEHPQAAEDEVAGARRRRMPWLAAAGVIVVVAVATALGVTVRDRSTAGGSGTATASPSSAAFSDSLIPGDSSKFIADETIPDGTQVKVNSQFVKVWSLQNVGKVVWHNRFLARTNPTADADGCQVPDRVAIGDTPPGEKVMISVPVTAPKRPGKCWVSWKMVDENGQEYFPTRRPVYFMVTVIA
ncbi:NBR1-Ig-like domain-containing protein [Micromonospora vulcania]|uniref:NBR1-Ig-like domain-containing protein n=1 Tax=Micromonospora vulcania TaxID=1441873 RepID=A0ABW1HCS5_9ACTN